LVRKILRPLPYRSREILSDAQDGVQERADHAVSVVEENLRLLERGRLDIPKGANVVSFLLSNGKISVPITVNSLTLRDLFEKYFDSLPKGSLEESTLYTMGIHRKTLETFFGADLVDAIPVGIQEYINERAGNKLSPVTIKKEVGTLRTVWTFGNQNKFVSEDFPRGLRYPKGEEKSPFMPFKEILKRTKGGDSELWECAYLTREDLTELLAFVKKAAKHPFIYAAIVFCAHTGARRSELARVSVSDLEDGFITLRERKRNRELKTTRRVPLSGLLKRVMKSWIGNRHDGPLFSHAGEALTRKALAYHFDRTLKGSKWKHLKGWHVLRHSFISIVASQGVDQRLVDEWSGNQTEQQRRRYRHLRPEPQQKTIAAVFG
jgi:integrase